MTRFERLYCAALSGLAAQFEQPACGNFGTYLYDSGEKELARSKELAWRAWILATDAEECFTEHEQVSEFNSEV